jgi:hypothetical protein
MTPDFVNSVTSNGAHYLQHFNQNTLHLCHNILRHLPKSETAFQNIQTSPKVDRINEIETFALDQIEKLAEISGKERLNKDYSVELPQALRRNGTEKRFVALLNHFINYSERNNKSVFNSLSVKYGDGSVGIWNKDKVDEFGGELKGTNPMKLFRFIKAVAHSADPHQELNFESPIIKEPSKELSFKDEHLEIDMSLIKDGTFDIPQDISEEDFLELVIEISQYAEALKYKENSIKLRQETLMSTYRGNPNGTLKDIILQTNTMSMNLKNEQLVLEDVVNTISEFALTNNFTLAISPSLEKINEVMDTYTLKADDKLNFIIRSEELDTILLGQPEDKYELAVGMRT